MCAEAKSQMKTRREIPTGLLLLAGLFASPLPARQISPLASSVSKDRILARWAQALGGEGRLSRVETIHLRARVETGGLVGTHEEWSTSEGRYRSLDNIGDAFKQIDVLDKTKGWVVDTSGSMHELADGDLEDQISAAYWDSFSYLVPGRMPGRVEVQGGSKSPPAYILKLLPDGGRPVTVYLDRSSFLPLRQEIVQGAETVTQYFSDWRAVDGVEFPWKIRQSTGNPKFDVFLTVEQVELNQRLSAELFAQPKSAAPPVRFASSHRVARFAFKPWGKWILVPVRVNGGPQSWFILDTGADASGIGQSRAKELGLQFKGALEATGTGGSSQMGLAKNLAFDLPGVAVPTRVVAIVPLDALAPALGRPLDGVLGYDVLSRFVVRIDYARKTVTLYAPGKFHGPGHGATLPITFAGNTPSVRAKILLPGREPIETSLTIDTGSGGFDLSAPFVRAHHVLASVGKTISSLTWGVGGKAERVEGRIAGLEFGPYTLRQPVTGFSRATRGSFASADLGGNIGGSILSRFTVTLDYPHQRLYLEPNSHFDEPFKADGSGLLLFAKGADFRRFEVEMVVANSPGAEAGIERGDIIAAIDGRPAKDFTLPQIEEMFRQDGRAFRLTIERDGRRFDVTLKLRPLI
jgi:PDZ domain/Aspartyl protease